MVLSNETGSVVEPFLYSGFNLAIWQSFGKTEYFIERLHSSEIGFARIFARWVNPRVYLYVSGFDQGDVEVGRVQDFLV